MMIPLTLLLVFVITSSLQATRFVSTIQQFKTVNPSKKTTFQWKRDVDNIDLTSNINLYFPIEEQENAKIRSLGGRAASDPCCVTSSTESTYCFIRDLTGVINYRSINKDSHWMSMHQYAVGDVECVAQGNGDITVIAVDITNTMTVNTLNQGQWLGWKKTEATQLMEVPGCIARRHSLVNCMYRNQKNEGVFISSTNNQWESVYPVGGVLLGPAACHGDDNTIFCYSIDMHFHLQVLAWELRKGIRPWKQLGNYFMTGRPSVTTHGRHAIDIFTIGPGSNLLWERRNERGRYLNWLSLGGPLGWRPECVGSRDRINCYTVSARSRFMSNSWNGSEWTGWRHIRRGYVGTPSCHPSLSDGNVISCFVRNAKTAGIDAFSFNFEAR